MDRWYTRLAAEYGSGLIGGVVLGGIAYLFGEFALGAVARTSGDWIAAGADLLAITALCFAVAIGSGEPIYRLAKREHPDWGERARKQLWKGGFLGAPAVIALLSLMEMDWPSIMAAPSPVFRVLLYAIGILQYVATAPLRLMVDVLGIPAEAPMVLALPIGALCVRYLARPENMLDINEPEDAQDHAAAASGG
ncbi:hypothetical protein HN371_20680 [Candidatus Poribacteria bacterium]|jgi:hypothetical protein|nr:hypothetical protein [Candidatus Poribacteria bacterium]MBT5709499.1 hypothetical protein [Candidatus Poribacteria bacterium]MBT7807572.1 hypothetical protein [Candidatus Poribacteria bacterium]